MRKLFGILIVLIAFCGSCMTVKATDKISVDLDSEEQIILQYYQYLNEKDVENYISLFTKEQQKLMLNHLLEYGEENFFRTEQIEAKNIKILSDETGYLASTVNTAEIEIYDALKCVYVEQEEEVTNNREIDSTTSYVCFVLARENFTWRIERVSVPNMAYIFAENEQFGNANEKEAAEKQSEQLKLLTSSISLLQDGETRSVTSLTAPTQITVYFTKTDNVNYHGSVRSSLNFSTYLRNTVGQEWTVAYYANYPSYLQAGVMASKMYAWYNTVNPKRNYAPYYACVLDNSNDQNYWCYSASNIESQGAQYLRYLENALSYANNLALVTEDSEDIFETQYRTSSGNIHGGILNQTAALELARNGYSCLEILQEYYGSSPVTLGDYVKIVAHQ